jgi:NADH dehydrogenase
MHRAYHVSRVPTFNRKVRVCVDWILAGFFRREAVTLTAFESPRGEFTEVAVPAPAPALETAAKAEAAKEAKEKVAA